MALIHATVVQRSRECRREGCNVFMPSGTLHAVAVHGCTGACRVAVHCCSSGLYAPISATMLMLLDTWQGRCAPCRMYRPSRAGLGRSTARLSDAPTMGGVLSALQAPTLPGLLVVTLFCTLPLSYMIIVTSKLAPLHGLHKRSMQPSLEALDPQLVQLVLELEHELSVAKDPAALRKDLLWALASLSVNLRTVRSSSSGSDAKGVASSSNSTLAKALLRLHQLGQQLPCVNNFAEYAVNVCGGGCLIASNLHDSEAIMPNYVAQLLTAISALGRAAQPTFVSIYESGSTDSTASWLLLLDKWLSLLGVNRRVVVGGPLQRAHGQDRIQFLASVRNAVLEPLLPSSAPGDGTPGHIAQASCGPHGCPAASRVVLLNDVYFCASDVLRLLQYDADIACGMDFIKASCCMRARLWPCHTGPLH